MRPLQPRLGVVGASPRVLSGGGTPQVPAAGGSTPRGENRAPPPVPPLARPERLQSKRGHPGGGSARPHQGRDASASLAVEEGGGVTPSEALFPGKQLPALRGGKERHMAALLATFATVVVVEGLLWLGRHS